jgi:hypothetical protein
MMYVVVVKFISRVNETIRNYALRLIMLKSYVLLLLLCLSELAVLCACSSCTIVKASVIFAHMLNK